MRVRVLFFAQYRDWAGTDVLELVVPAGATARDLVSQIRADSRLSRIPAEPALALNQTYASLNSALQDGDEVALLPPVAGG